MKLNMQLDKKLQTLPTLPGVYLMKNKDSVIIYVGKAINLRSRVFSYFRDSTTNLKTRVLAQEIYDIEVIITTNELEAIILERNLIKLHKPKFNVLLKDNKDYPYLRVDFNEPWPRIEKVRRKEDDGAFYLGPFGNEGALSIALKLAGNIFPLIRCSRHEFKNRKRPCNYYSMNMCLAPCTQSVNRELYVSIVKDAVAFLMGNNQDLIRDLKRKMYEASNNQQYELAAQYRDQLYAVNKISERQSAIIKNIKNVDVFGFYQHNDDVCINVINIKDGKILFNENFILNTKIHNASETLASFLLQYYETRPISDEIICSHFSKDMISIIDAILVEQKLSGIKNVKISCPTRGIRKHLIEMSLKNAQYHMEQNIQIEQSYQTELEILQKTLGLFSIPYRIEAIDISNFQADSIVGSVVCFINGKPAKDQYRRYEIKNLKSKAQDDFSSIKEVLRRRIVRAIKENTIPNLIVIDGGPAQLNSALDVLKDFVDIDVNIISLAKSRLLKRDIDPTYSLSYSAERVYIPIKDQKPKLIELKEGSAEYRLLTYIRNEAHRFAIFYHRKKRLKKFFTSELDMIPRVGPITKQKLLEHFGSIDSIKNATLEQLKSISGLKKSVAIKIYNYFKSL